MSDDTAEATFRAMAEEFVLAGYPGGDRAVVLANIRTVLTEVAALRRGWPCGEAVVKRFPVMGDGRPHPQTIPWPMAELAYSVYRYRHGSAQSLERLAERGGFGVSELDELLPSWRADLDSNVALERQVAASRAALEFIAGQRDKAGNWAVEYAKQALASFRTRAEGRP